MLGARSALGKVGLPCFCVLGVSCPRTGSLISADMRKWHYAQSEVDGADPFLAVPVVDPVVVEVIY